MTSATLRERFVEARHQVKQQAEHFEHVVKEQAEHFEHVVKQQAENIEHEFAHAKETILKYIGSMEDAPRFMHFNTYIKSGYRIHFHDFDEIIGSLFSLHNETINIWSHLIGFVVMIIFFVHTVMTFEFINTSDFLMFSLFFLGACAMFLLSTLYHLFNCTHDHQVFNRLLTCDYIGIFSMILGSAISGFHFAFHCFWLERTVYQAAIAIICILGVFFVAFPQSGDNHTFRVLFYLFSVSFTALPVAHMAVAFGLYDTTQWWVLLGLYAAGLAIYASKFPERHFPGKFDFLFSSHQLWHFFILMAGCWHYYSIATLYHQRVTEGCNL